MSTGTSVPRPRLPGRLGERAASRVAGELARWHAVADLRDAVGAAPDCDRADGGGQPRPGKRCHHSILPMPLRRPPAALPETAAGKVTAGELPPPRSRSLAAVDTLAQQVGMTCVAGIFLDHVDGDPAQADLLADAGMQEGLVKIVTGCGCPA